MPYSKHLKFIHVAIPKTGSTSMVNALANLNQTHEAELTLVNEKINPAFRQQFNLNKIGDSKPGKAKHLSAIQLKYILGDEEFDRCFKFSIVRNSWSRMASVYFFHHADYEPSSEEKIRRGTTRKFHKLDFDSWVTKKYSNYKNKNKNKSSQLSKLTDLEGRLIVDYVGRLDTIQPSLDYICSKVGVKPISMPHTNGTNKTHYSHLYSQKTRDMVHEMCLTDIEYFNFSFEDRRNE